MWHRLKNESIGYWLVSSKWNLIQVSIEKTWKFKLVSEPHLDICVFVGLSLLSVPASSQQCSGCSSAGRIWDSGPSSNASQPGHPVCIPGKIWGCCAALQTGERLLLFLSQNHKNIFTTSDFFDTRKAGFLLSHTGSLRHVTFIHIAYYYKSQKFKWLCHLHILQHYRSILIPLI